MAGELTPKDRELHYRNLVANLQKDIREKRQSSSHVLSRLWGQIRGKYLVVTQEARDERNVDLMIGRGLAQGLGALNFVVPVLGTALQAAVTKGLSLLTSHHLKQVVEQRGEMPPTLAQQAQWLAKRGADNIEASIAKLEKAQQEFSLQAGKGVSTCDDFIALVRSFYTWKYRHERLLARTEFLQQYAEALSAEVRRVGGDMANAEKKLSELGPQVYASWRWHANCFHGGSQECVYPWDTEHLKLVQDRPPTTGFAPLAGKGLPPMPNPSAMEKFVRKPVGKIPPVPPLPPLPPRAK